MDHGGYQLRKLERTIEHHRKEGVGCETCAACSGSGRYDNTGSPYCSSCGGTGRKRLPLRSRTAALVNISHLRTRQALSRIVSRSPAMSAEELSARYAKQIQIERRALGLDD